MVCFAADPDSCVPCKEDWIAQLGDIERDVDANLENFYRHTEAKALPTQLKLFETCADAINENFKGYYADANKRKFIAAKMLEMEHVLQKIGSPFPVTDIFLLWKSTDGSGVLERIISMIYFEYDEKIYK